MNNTFKITGSEAIRLAERDQLTIHCYANPIDDGGVVNIGVARQIVKEDGSLIYVTVTQNGWIDSDGHAVSEMPGYNIADYFMPDGTYLGPDDDGVEPRWDDGPSRVWETTIKTHVEQASVEARADMANGRWDEVMTDALYTDCGAQTVEEMADARRIAEITAKELIHSPV